MMTLSGRGIRTVNLPMALLLLVGMFVYHAGLAVSSAEERKKDVNEISWALEEHLGEDWENERLTYACELPVDLVSSSLAVREENGAVLPAQFVADRPGSRTGDVHFIADLPAHSRRHWTLISASGAQKSDIFAKHVGADMVEFGASHLAIRIPIGQWQASQGKEPEDVAAPILAFKAADSGWTGSARMHSPYMVTAFKGEITQKGPVLIQAVLTYTFGQHGSYTVELEALAGQEVILIRETMDLDQQSGFLKNTVPSDAPADDYIMKGYGEDLRQNGSFWELSLAGSDWMPDRVAWRPIYRTWERDPAHGDPARTFSIGKGARPLVTLNPSHGEWWLNDSQWAGVYQKSGGPFVGVLALQANDWRRPHENVPVLESDAEGRPYYLLPINGGSRYWALYAAKTEDIIPLADEEPSAEEYPGLRYVRAPQIATIKYGLVSLNDVKDWSLAWESDSALKYPHIYADADKMTEIRERISENEKVEANTETLKKRWDDYRAQEDPQFPLYEKYIVYPRGLDNIYFLTGDESYLSDLSELVRARLKYYIHQTLRGIGVTDYRWGHNYGMFHLTISVLPIAIRQADFLLGAGNVSEQEKTELKAMLAFFGYLLSHDAYWPIGQGYNMGNTDMVASLYAELGKIGSLLKDHPMAEKWVEKAVAGIERSLDSGHHLPDFSQDEWYGFLTLDMITQVAAPMKRAGFHNFFADPRYKHGMEFYGKLLTPPSDPRYDGGYIAPFGNGQGRWNRSVSWGVAAYMTAQSDPEFSEQMQYYWKRSGTPVRLKYGDRDDFGWSSMGWIDPGLPEMDHDSVSSSYVEGWGAVMHSGVGTGQETYMALQLGKPAGLRNYNAEGGFHLYAKGKPLCLTFGIRAWDASVHKGYPNVTQQRWFANRLTFDEANEQCDGTGKLLEWASLPEADLAVGEWTITALARVPKPRPFEGPDRLELSKPRAFKEDDSYRLNVKQVDPIKWQRRVLFVKDEDPTGPNYFLFHDKVESTLPSDWNVWCLAESMELGDDNQEAHFKGKYDVDLDVYSLLPANDVVTGAYGPVNSSFGFYRQRLYQLQQSSNGDYFVLLYPRLRDEQQPKVEAWGTSGVRIGTDSWTHYAFLSHQPVDIQKQGLMFRGTVGVLRRKGQVRSIALPSASGGKASLDGLTLENEPGGAVSVQANLKTGDVTGYVDGHARRIHLTLPDGRLPAHLIMNGKEIEFSFTDGSIGFTAPSGGYYYRLTF